MKYLLVIMATLLCCTSTFAAPRGATTQYLPAKGNILVHFDMARVQKSQTFKDAMGFLMARPDTKKNLKKFQDQFGVDPFKDVKTMTVHIDAPVPNTPPNLLVQIEGNFKEAKLIEGLKKDKKVMLPTKVGNKTIYIDQQKQNGMSVGLHFFKGGILMGSADVVKKAMTGAHKFGGPLKQISAHVKSGAQDLWFAMNLSDKMLADLKKKNPMMGQFSKISGFLDLAQGVRVYLEAQGNDDKAAKSIAQMMNMQLQGALKNPQAAMFAGMIKKFKAEAKGKMLTVDLPLNQQDVNQLKMLAGMFMMGMQKPKQAKPPAFPPIKPPAPKSKKK